ncbi:MAG: RluA family pseudouridine synthase [Candidatus Omnitrophica bacterium]|nr:RluA family pseudouridine synthase [Candidatus Omnitrophota bacterium]
MAQTYQFVVGPDEARLRIDRYLLRHLPQGFSRTIIQRAIRGGAITIAGRALKAHRRLRAGETVVARVAGPSAGPDPQTVVPEPMALAVVYEDAHVLVVNKPPRLVTHPAPGHPSGTLVNAIAWHLSQHAECGTRNAERSASTPHSARRTPHLPRAGIVHRLDQDTSGLLVVAKTALALRELAKQLKARTMSRRYLALVEGHVPVDEGTINVGVGRHLTHRKEMAVRYLGGREAVTHYRVLKRFSLSLAYTLLELRLETGRTHQIRVHLAHLGYPVLGDALYSRRSAGSWNALGIARQLLHAYAVRFMHPATHQPLELSVGLPVDMQHWLDGFDARAAVAVKRRR